MAIYKLIECDYDMPDPTHYPHHLEIDGTRIMTDARYEDVLRYVQNNLLDGDTVIDLYHTGTETHYTGTVYLAIIPHIWRFD